MYIGQMELWFKNAALLNGHTEENAIKEIIEKNAMTFGFIQILCVVWAVPIGKNKKIVETKKNFLTVGLQAAFIGCKPFILNNW